MKLKITTLALWLLSFHIASAGMHDESSFTGTSPFTFDGFNLPCIDQDVKFLRNQNCRSIRQLCQSDANRPSGGRPGHWC